MKFEIIKEKVNLIELQKMPWGITVKLNGETVVNFIDDGEIPRMVTFLSDFKEALK